MNENKSPINWFILCILLACLATVINDKANWNAYKLLVLGDALIEPEPDYRVGSYIELESSSGVVRIYSANDDDPDDYIELYHDQKDMYVTADSVWDGRRYQ